MSSEESLHISVLKPENGPVSHRIVNVCSWVTLLAKLIKIIKNFSYFRYRLRKSAFHVIRLCHIHEQHNLFR